MTVARSEDRPEYRPSLKSYRELSAEMLTATLKQALFLIDVKLLDHFIVAQGGAMSFVERGML